MSIESTISNRWSEPDQPSSFKEAFDERSNLKSKLSVSKSTRKAQPSDKEDALFSDKEMRDIINLVFDY